MASEYVGIDLHRRRAVIVRQDAAGEVLEQVRIDNDPVALALAMERAGCQPEVVLEATYGWYWAVDVLQAAGARVHLAHPLGVQGWAHRRVKNDELDAAGLVDLLRFESAARSVDRAAAGAPATRTRAASRQAGGPARGAEGQVGRSKIPRQGQDHASFALG